MNKFINVLLGFILFPIMLLSIFVGLDVHLQMLKMSGSEIPYHREVLMVLGLLVVIINIRRSARRWMGMHIVRQSGKFEWNQPVSNQRKSRVRTYLFMESLVYLSIAVALFVLTSKAWVASLGFLIPAVDNILLAIVGEKWGGFRVGLSRKALIVVDREVIVIYFKGLRKISKHQQTIYFDFIKDLQLSFPADCISTQNQSEFYEQLRNVQDTSRVLVSEKLAD